MRTLVNSVVMVTGSEMSQWRKKPTSGQLVFLDEVWAEYSTKVRQYVKKGNTRWYIYIVTDVHHSKVYFDVYDEVYPGFQGQ